MSCGGQSRSTNPCSCADRSMSFEYTSPRIALAKPSPVENVRPFNVGVGAVGDPPVRPPDVEGDDLLAQRGVGQQRVERRAVRLVERILVEQVLQVRRDEAVDVQARDGAQAVHHAALDLARDHEPDREHPEQQDGKTRDQELARQTQLAKGGHGMGTRGERSKRERRRPRTKVGSRPGPPSGPRPSPGRHAAPPGTPQDPGRPR